MTFRFSDCELDPGTHVLRRGGEPVHVEPQVFDVICLLVEAGGALVSYDDLIERVWGGRIVSDATLAARVSAARAAVGDDGRAQRVIRTVQRRGLRLVVPVSQDNGHTRPGAGQPEPLAQDIRLATSADGSGIAWSAIGDGPPLMRAGHWMTHLERDLGSLLMRPWIERLGRGRRLIRYDPRGTGMSDRDSGPRSLEANVADLAAVADAAGLGRFDLFCASQAAAAACCYAADNPDRVRRLVLYGGFAQGSLMRSGGEGEAMTEAMAAMIRQGWGQPDGGYMRAFASMFMPSASAATMRDFVAMQLASASPEDAVEIRACCARYDVTAILPRVRAPTLVAHSARDNLHPYSQAQLFARLIPNARIKQLDSANHVLLPDEPAFAALMDAVDAFLAGPG